MPITAFVARRKVLLVGLAVLLVGGLAGRVVLLGREQTGSAAGGGDSLKTKRGSELSAPAASATIQLPHGVTDILAADGGVWVASSAGVQRIDPATNSIAARIPLAHVGRSGMLAWADGSMWATQESGLLTRIDPLTNRAIASVVLGGMPVALAAGRKVLWIAVHDPSGGPERVLTVDPTTNSITTTWRLARGMDRLSFVDGTLWAGSNGDVPRVASIDPADGQLISVREHELPETSADGALWTAANGAVRIDPHDGSTMATVGAGSVDQVAAGLGAVWALTRTGSRSRTMSDDDSNPATVVAIDPATNRVVGAPVPIGASPAHMTVGAGAVWVAQYDSGLVTRVELH